MVGSETWEVKSRGGRGQRRSSWRMLVRTQGTEMGPSQRPPPPGSPGRWTCASTVRGVGSVPSGISCLILEDGPCTLRFSLTPPGRSVPNTAATWGLGGGRGARLGPGWDREDAGQHVEAQGEAAGAFINHLPSWRECGRAFRLSCCVSSISGKMRCWRLWALGKQKFPNSFLTSLKTVSFELRVWHEIEIL